MSPPSLNHMILCVNGLNRLDHIHRLRLYIYIGLRITSHIRQDILNRSILQSYFLKNFLRLFTEHAMIKNYGCMAQNPIANPSKKEGTNVSIEKFTP